MQELSRRNEHFTDSVIRRMTRISIDCGAINLAQGFPDFDPPKAMTDRLEEVSRLGPHQYPITMGAPNFRQARSRKCERFMGMKYDPETEMVVTIGSTEAMVDTIFALTNPGDKIIMFSPYFENYRAQAIMADCEQIFVPLVPPAFNFDANVLEDAFKQGAKAILIEAECPEKADDEAMAARRLGFYARCGAVDTGWTEHLFDAWFRVLVLPCGSRTPDAETTVQGLVDCYRRTMGEPQWRKYVTFYRPDGSTAQF